MSLGRFALYFVAVMACGVAAFPHWAPAPAPVSIGDLTAAMDRTLPTPYPHAKLTALPRHKSAGASHLMASN